MSDAPTHYYRGENLIVVTGLPGRGKTLLALWLADQVGRGRPVYVCGVRGLKDRDGWHVLEDAHQWEDTPEGAVIVIDEAQRVFEPAAASAKVGAHIRGLETVRHGGRTLILTTQHPMLLHGNVRRLTQAHLHLVRKFGENRAQVYRWEMVADVGTRSALIASVKSARMAVWAYPVEVFQWYESAEVHTVQRKRPWQRYALYAAPLVVLGLIGVAVWKLGSLATAPGELVGGQAGVPGASPAGQQDWQSGGQAAGARGRVMTAREYVQARAPRIDGLPWTAPAYDEITKPVRVAMPAACLEMAGRCRCYSQQATPVNVGVALCRAIVANGLFEEFDRDGKDAQRVGQARQVVAGGVVKPGGVGLGVIADAGDYRGTSVRTTRNGGGVEGRPSNTD